MGRLLTITRSNEVAVGRRKKVISRKMVTGPVTLAAALIFLICLLSLFFLAQVFQSSTKGYEISELESNMDELKEQNKSLEIRAAELRSFETIKNEAEKLNMVQAERIVYIRQSGTSVVVAN